MSIYYKTAVRETKEVRPSSPAQAEEIVTAGVPIGGVPGLGPLEQAILRLALNPHSGSAQAAAELLAQLRNINIQANAPLWLRAEAIRSIVALSRRAFVTRVHGLPVGERPVITPNRFEIVGYENGEYSERVAITELVERASIFIPLAGRGARGAQRVSRDIPEYVSPSGEIIVQEVLPWDFPWDLYLLAYLPHAMRGVFRTDDFYPPPMSRQAPAGPPKSFDYTYGDRYDEISSFADLEPDPAGDTTAGAALLNVFLSELSPIDRFICHVATRGLVTTKGNATPDDLADLLGISPDAARKRLGRVLERAAKVAETSQALQLRDSDFIWQPEGRPGPYSGRDDKDGRALYQRFMAQCDAASDDGKLRRRLIDFYADAELARRILGRKTRIELEQTFTKSALYRYGKGKSLDELGRRAWTKPTLGPLERRPMSLGVYADEGNLVVASGCDRIWSETRGTRGQPHEKAESLDESQDTPQGDSDPTAPSREYKPRCLERGCSRRVATPYQSRALEPVNAEAHPSRIPAPKEKADANLYCKQHLQERKETMEVTQAEIADRLRGLEDLHGELREAMSQTLTALTWRFPDDEELLEAVDSFRRDALGQHGVQVLADE